MQRLPHIASRAETAPRQRKRHIGRLHLFPTSSHNFTHAQTGLQKHPNSDIIEWLISGNSIGREASILDYAAILADWTSRRGLSGDEAGIAGILADAFSPYCTVETDPLQNVIARMGEGDGPLVMIAAHQDEIGLMASFVEEDGSIRLRRVGGVDPRILPGARVWVHAEGGVLPGVIGALPPHLLDADARKRNYQLDDLFVDLGLPADQAIEKVPAGTLIALHGPLTRLANGRLASKTMDDRAGIAVMLRAAQLLSGRRFRARVAFVAASQEEVGSLGARTAAYALNPDLAVAIDVTHGQMPGCDPDSTYPLDTVVATAGPYIHPILYRHLMDTAKAEHVAIQKSFSSRDTSTDADEMQITRSGVPAVLLELPLKYMHTTVETLSEDTLEEAARLLAAFITGLDEKEAVWLCLKD